MMNNNDVSINQGKLNNGMLGVGGGDIQTKAQVQ